MWLCKTRPSKWLITRKCGYLIILLVVAAQCDIKFQYENFSIIRKEEGLGCIEIVFMIALLLVILFYSSPFVIFLLWFMESLFIRGMGFVRIIHSNISVDYYKKDWQNTGKYMYLLWKGGWLIYISYLLFPNLVFWLRAGLNLWNK